MAQEKINASNKSTELLNFLGIHYQSAFHKDFKVAIIAESVTNAQPKTANKLCTPQSIFRVRFSFYLEATFSWDTILGAANFICDSSFQFAPIHIGFTVSDRYRSGCLVLRWSCWKGKIKLLQNSSHKQGWALEKEAQWLTVANNIPINVVDNIPINVVIFCICKDNWLL